MKKLAQWGLKQAFNKLALISFVVANVSPAFAQNVGLSATYIPLPPAMFYDPSLIMQTQANINIYGDQGNSLGQLMPGSVFQTPFARDPFHHVMAQQTLSYPAILGTAVQMPTPMGPMIPGTLEQAAMMTNGMTLPIDTNFYIPPADFSYERIRAIGARADSNDEDINRMIDELLLKDEELSESTYRPYKPKTENSDFYSRPLPKQEDVVRPATNAPAPQAVQTQTEVVVSNTPFKILGPTCGCRDKGASCVYNRANSGRNMFKGKRKSHHGTRTHDGVDIVARSGTPIIAAADGTVTRVMDQGKKGYGRRIDITHVDGFMTRYAHLSRWIVKPGQKVRKGQIIGYSGNTGASSGAHLHFEACKLRSGENRCNDANVVDPLKYMSNGGSNQQTQLNMSCTEAAAVGGASAPASSSGTSRAARSSRAAQ